MAKDPKAVIDALKPLRGKFPKSAPPYLSQDWNKFVAAVDKTLAALEKAKEPTEIVKARADYAAKKNELKTLKTKVNSGLATSKAQMSAARSAQVEVMTLANSIGQVVKSKQNEPATKALDTAMSAYAQAASREFSGLVAGTSIDDNL